MCKGLYYLNAHMVKFKQICARCFRDDSETCLSVLNMKHMNLCNKPGLKPDFREEAL